ncbi:hypothetical protein BpJC7_00020 [Weizmannia acidilactici]|uniref:Core domain-containing protein n=2 Tax=Weizmannia acidilactici TaxID=2607726 RepID=A0A5J4JBS9_9BACI|nr:hypothetical protein BpJC7_00020 [Weizmannia acidilactici]GER74255.1 hypothetical protein BpPP18_23220 [Weizmannia acidilactici]
MKKVKACFAKKGKRVVERNITFAKEKVKKMEIIIKPAALSQFKQIYFNEGEGIRIEAVFVGSCSIAVEHYLKLDCKREDDDLFNVYDISMLISKSSQKQLHNKVTIDYNPKMGYKLSSDEEVYQNNLDLTRAE